MSAVCATIAGNVSIVRVEDLWDGHWRLDRAAADMGNNLLDNVGQVRVNLSAGQLDCSSNATLSSLPVVNRGI